MKNDHVQEFMIVVERTDPQDETEYRIAFSIDNRKIRTRVLRFDVTVYQQKYMQVSHDGMVVLSNLKFGSLVSGDYYRFSRVLTPPGDSRRPISRYRYTCRSSHA